MVLKGKKRSIEGGEKCFMNKVFVIKQNLGFIGKTWVKCMGSFLSILSIFCLF